MQHFQRLLGARILGLQMEQLLQHLSACSLSFRSDVQTGKIQIGLVEVRGNTDAGLELLLRLRIILPPDKENAEVIQRFRIIRTQLNRLCR